MYADNGIGRGEIILLLTVGVGIVAHELSHTAVLDRLGIQCEIDIGPERVVSGQFDANSPGTWTAVTPRESSPETSAWAMRLSSIAPWFLLFRS